MRTAPKIALSLLITILLFSGLAVAAYAGLFNILETRFYQSAVIGSMEKQLRVNSEALNVWHTQNNEKFSILLDAEPVKRSLLPNQSAQDIFDRSNLAGAMMGEMPGLIGIRIIDAGDSTISPQDDKGTRRIHFSTFKEDILKKEDLQISYQNYGSRSDDLPFKTLSLADGSQPKLLVEKGKDLFLYCFPFYDAYATWRGTAVFYVSARAASQYLVSQNISRISDDLNLLTNDEHTVSGTVTGMPQVGQEILGEAVLNRWTSRNFTTDRIVSTDSGGWVLLSSETGTFGYTGQLVAESFFTFPRSVKLLFLAITFLTLYLVVFLFFNLKQDDMMVIRNRIRKFHLQLLTELIDKNEEVRWEEIRKNLSSRKPDISSEIKKSFGNRLNKKHGGEIDQLLGKSWDEILSALGQQETKQSELTNTDEIRKMLEQVLQNNAMSAASPATVSPTVAPPKTSPPKAAPVKQIQASTLPDDDIEEMEEVEDLEDLDELAEESVIPADTEISQEPAEELEELEELDELVEEAEAPEEIEEVTEEVEEIQEVEELEEAVEAPEEIEEVTEEVEEAEEVQEEIPADLEELDESEELEELDEIDELEELDESEKLEEPVEKPEIEVVPWHREKQEDELEEELDELEEEIDEFEEPGATENYQKKYVEEKGPDEVLVYNFEEKPGLDSGTRDRIFPIENDPNSTIEIVGPDFTSLDMSLSDTEEASEVDYIDTFIFTHTIQLYNNFTDDPVFEYLEVVGEENPEELVDFDENPLPEDGAITDRDGLFLVASNATSGSIQTIDPEFQKLVDSVLH